VRAGSSLKKFQTAYNDKVRIVFKHFPLSFHKDAHLAHQASVEAHQQGKFWQYHKVLFANMQDLKRPALERYAQQIGLNMDSFKQALDTGKHKAIVDRDIREGGQVGVGGTPTVFINGKKAEFKNYDFETIKQTIDPILIKKGFNASNLPTEVRHDITIGDAPTKGPKDAPVTVVEFSDFECGYCSVAARLVNQLVERYQNTVRIAFKHYPLSFHKDAHLAAQASMAAHAQGKFWEYHDLLFANQQKLKRPELESYAQKLGLDMTRFKEDLNKQTYRQAVENDIEAGRSSEVQGTPAFYINGRQVMGGSLESLAKVIDQELTRRGIKPPPPLPEPKKTAPSAQNASGSCAAGTCGHDHSQPTPPAPKPASGTCTPGSCPDGKTQPPPPAPPKPSPSTMPTNQYSTPTPWSRPK
jgi:protein-disulfide isomerase